MKAQIIIISLLVFSAIALRSAKLSNTGCVCSELQQADCTTTSPTCSWANTTCSAATLNCTSYNSTTCDTVTGCAWNSNSTCAAFTKCSDYTVSDIYSCVFKDVTCAPGNVTNGSYPCTTQTVTSCSTITDQFTCSVFGCLYSNNTCGTKYCANITTADQCVNVGSSALNNLGLCKWNTTNCLDAADTTALTSSNCLSNTQGTYAWKNNACTACTGSSSSTLLAFIGFAATLLY